jgi:hypothetical protein
MWLFTRYGFFSTVCARQGDGRQGHPPDPTRIMVRTRLLEHLQGLKQRFPEVLGHCVIHEFAGTDYTFRIILDKTVWIQLVAELAGEIDYDNFKSEVRRHQGRAGAPYENALHDVWDVMYRVQGRAPSRATPFRTILRGRRSSASAPTTDAIVRLTSDP